jgi:hypothetical protein
MSPGLFEGAKDGGLATASLPMTAHPTSRPSKREVGSVQFTGPNANYMSALARLFDAAQVIGMFLFSLLFFFPCPTRTKGKDMIF